MTVQLGLADSVDQDGDHHAKYVKVRVDEIALHILDAAPEQVNTIVFAQSYKSAHDVSLAIISHDHWHDEAVLVARWTTSTIVVAGASSGTDESFLTLLVRSSYARLYVSSPSLLLAAQSVILSTVVLDFALDSRQVGLSEILISNLLTIKLDRFIAIE